MSRIFRPIGICMAFIVTAAMYIAPYGILGEGTQYFGETFKATHTMLMHHLVVLYLVLSIVLRLCRPRWRASLLVGALGVIYVAVAIPLAYRFDANYCNLLSSEVPVMESVRLAAGQKAYTILIAVSLTFGTAVGALLYIALHRAVGFLFKALWGWRSLSATEKK